MVEVAKLLYYVVVPVSQEKISSASAKIQVAYAFDC
jgi:hypothetical protein